MRKMNVIGLLVGLCLAVPTTAGEAPTVLRWRLVHAPTVVFLEMAKKFKEKVEKESRGQLKVEIEVSGPVARDFLTDPLEREKINSLAANDGRRWVEIEREKSLDKIQSGEIDMAQVYSMTLAKKFNPQFQGLELPFAFEDDEHVNRVIEGEVGKNLLASLDAEGLKGLSYTYSGGLLNIVSRLNLPFVSVSKWKNNAIAASGSEMRRRMFEFAGSEYIDLPNREPSKDLMKRGVYHGYEINYPDLAKMQGRVDSQKNSRMISDTRHTLLTTVVIMSGKKFQSLSKEHQDLVSRTAVDVARFERNLTIRASDEAKQSFLENGNVVVRTMSASGRAKAREFFAPVYEWYRKNVKGGAAIIEGIERERAKEVIAGR